MSGLSEGGVKRSRVGVPTGMRRLRLTASMAVVLATVSAGEAADARQTVKTIHRRGVAGSDVDRTLARMAERDGVLLWPRWRGSRPLASYLPPLNRQQVTAPPLTGWGYGYTIPGAWPGF